ncbi:acyltransferase family protein [Rufibacter hautae]|uniref:acyltransferase family protein n=1 Tax=Rufibacter hautae TaxID=2595005 RepID=UPI0016803B67|nr:acyltransferase [Rufibacter hautae]
MESTVQPPLRKSKNIFFENINGLRFVGFLLVYIPHAFPYLLTDSKIKSVILNFILDSVFKQGNGVSLFFVISGFFVTLKLLKELDKTASINLKRFYLYRITRIWPLYFAFLFFSFVVYPYAVSIYQHPTNYCSRPTLYFLFLSNFDVIRIAHTCKGYHVPFTLITWSVGVQEQFYFLFPFFFKWLPKKALPLLLGFVVMASIIFKIIYIEDEVKVYYHTISISADIAMGALGAYFIYTKPSFRYSFNRMSPQTFYMLVGLGMLFFLTQSLFNNFIYAIILRKLLLTSFYTLVILILTHHPKGKSFSFKPAFINFWGTYTYGLYFFHLIFLTLIDVILRIFGIDTNNVPVILAIGLLALLFSMAGSYISFHYFESKFLKLRSLFLKK